MTQRADDVESRDDLVRFLAHLSSGATSFENRDLGVFLEAASGWLGDLDGFFLNQGLNTPESPSWKLVAQIFAAAAVYE